MSRSTGLRQTEKTNGKEKLLLTLFLRVHVRKSVNLCVLTHCVPHVDVVLASPVIALREGLPIREHVAFRHVCALSKAVVVHPGSPVVHVARTHLSIGC